MCRTHRDVDGYNHSVESSITMSSLVANASIHGTGPEVDYLLVRGMSRTVEPKEAAAPIS